MLVRIRNNGISFLEERDPDWLLASRQFLVHCLILDIHPFIQSIHPSIQQAKLNHGWYVKHHVYNEIQDANLTLAYKYLEELYRKKQSDVFRFLLRVRCWEYRYILDPLRLQTL